MLFRSLALAIAVLALAALSGEARGSELIDRNAQGVKLAVNAQGQALLTFRARGRTWHVLAWGAVDAIAPTQARKQVKFKLDYSGGYGTYKRDVWKTFSNVCGKYTGEATLGWLVAACTAPDGSHWALQSWQRGLPNYGLRPSAKQAVWELRLSHWTGEPGQLEIGLDWAYRRFDHLFGNLTYRGEAVHGFRSTPSGMPLDTFGRNLYVDTYGSEYGAGWQRENSFLTQKPTGTFCYGFFPHGGRPSGKGARYRATVIGPGVTPDLLWQSDARGPYDRTLDLTANFEQLMLFPIGGNCRSN
ncbi:MAG: hypothetical protein H0V40_03440 [Actinobacteria bacterium]|nr:hypothetical protein [Actinomycetota bacterium]